MSTSAPDLAADHVKHVERLWRTVKSIQATESPETPLAIARRNYRDLTRALYIVKAVRRGSAHALYLRSHDERMALEDEWEEQIAAALNDLLPLIDIDAAWHEAHRSWANPVDPPDGMIVGHVGVVEALLENTVRKKLGDKPKPGDMKVIEEWGGQRAALAKKILKSGNGVVLRLKDGTPYAVAEIQRATGNLSVRSLVTSPAAQHHGQDALQEVAIEAARTKSNMHVHPANATQEDYFARLGFVKNIPPPPPVVAAGEGVAAGGAGAAAFTPAAEEAMSLTAQAVLQVVQQGGFSPFPQTQAGVRAALASGVNEQAWARGAYSRYIGLTTKTATQAGQMSMEHLGINKTFAFAHPQNMARDMFGVRGSKIIQQMYGEHMNKLTQIIVDATSPKAPLTIQETTKRIKAEWPRLTKYQAVRIARTETAAVWMHTAANAYAANGIGEWESIVAKGPIIEVDAQGACGFCTEQAAHTHSMDDVVIPPYHPHCRCDIVPVLEDPHTGEPWLPPDEPWAGGGELAVQGGHLGPGKLIAAPEPSAPLGGPLAFTNHVLPKPAERAALKADVEAWPSFTPSATPTGSFKVAAQEMLDAPLPIKAMRTGLGNATGIASYQNGFMLPNMGHTILVHRIETATGSRYAMLRGFAEDAHRGKTDWLAIQTEWLPAAMRKKLTDMGFEPVPYQTGILRLRTSELPERFKFDPTDAPPAPAHVAPAAPDAPPLVPPAPPPPPPKLTFKEWTDVDAFNAKLAQSPYKQFVTEHTAEEFKATGTRIYVSKDGNVMFTVTRSGDIQNVVALPAAPKGAGGQAVEEAIRRGGTHLDAYDGWLTGFYEKFGFRVTGRMRWVDEYAQEGWDYAKFKRPDVVFMSLAKEGTEARLAAQVLFRDWDAAKGWSRALGGGATIEEARAAAFAESAIAKLGDEGRYYLDRLGAEPESIQRYRVVTQDSEVVLDDVPGVANLAEYFTNNLVHLQAKGKLKDKLFFQGWTDEAGRAHLGVGTSFRQLPSARAFAAANKDARILDAKTGEYVAVKTPDVGPAPQAPLPPEVVARIHEKGLDQWPPSKGAKSIEILGDKSDTVALYTKNGIWAQERESLHKNIIERHFEGKVEATGQPTVYLTSGGGASGKSNSTFRVGDKDMTLDELKVRSDVVVIDPDAIKAMLPEYQDIAKAGDAYASFAAHEESKALARAVKQLAQKRGYNIVLDTTGSGKSFIGKLQSFKDAGYRVEVTMTSVPTREAVIRSIKRGDETGRYVAVHALSRAHREASRAFAEWKSAGYVDEWRLFDNTTGRVLVAEKRAGQEIKVYDEEKLKAIQHKAGEADVEIPVAPDVPTKLPPPPVERKPVNTPTPETPGPSSGDFPSTAPIEGMAVKFEQVGGGKGMPQIERFMNVDDAAGVRVGMINYKQDADGIHIYGIAVEKAQRGRGIAAAMTVRLREELGGDLPMIHGSFSSPEGAGFGVYMSARYPEWNKLWLDVKPGETTWWTPGATITTEMGTFGPLPYGKYGAAQKAVDDALAAAARAKLSVSKLDEPSAPLAPDGFLNSTSKEADDAIRVYTAESDLRDKFGPGNQFDVVESTTAHQASAERYAQDVWERNKDLYRGKTTRNNFVSVRTGQVDNPNRSELAYVAEGAAVYPRITLGRNMQDQLTILHEEAHAMFGPVLQNEIGHSEEFQRVFVTLLRREMPTTYADGIEFRLGIKVPHVPKPGFEPTAPPTKDWAWADGEVRRPVTPDYAPGYEDWQAGLPASQLSAIKSWTEGTEAAGINIDIRAGKTLTEAQQKQADALDKLVATAPDYDGPVTVWRGVTLDGTWTGVDNVALETRLLKEFPVGSRIQPEGYQATSFGTDAALDASMNKSNIGMVFEIKTTQGALLKDMSKFKNEDELLLSRAEEWEVKRITRETFERWEDQAQLERYVVQVEAVPRKPVTIEPQKLSPEPFEPNVVAVGDTGISMERAAWLRAEAETWASADARAAVTKLVDDAENGLNTMGAAARLIELRDGSGGLRGLVGVSEYEGATFAKSLMTVTDLAPSTLGDVLGVKQALNAAAQLARGKYATLRVDASRIHLNYDEWLDVRTWAQERGFAVGATDDVYWSAKVDDLVKPMRLDEVKQAQFEVPVPPKAKTISPEVVGGLHVEVADWPGVKGAKELLQRAAADKKFVIKVTRDEDGALETLAAARTTTDLSGKPLTTAEVYTSTGEPLVDVIPSLVDDAQKAGARLEIVANDTLTSDTLMALGMKRVEGTKRWYAQPNEQDIVRLRAEAAEGKPFYGTPKPVPEAEPTAMPTYQTKYVAEDTSPVGSPLSSDVAIKLQAEADAAIKDVTTAVRAKQTLAWAEKNPSAGIVVVRDEHGVLAGVARYSEDYINKTFRVDAFYTNGDAAADVKLFDSLAAKMLASPRDEMVLNPNQWRSSAGFLDDLKLRGFGEADEGYGALSMTKDDVAGAFKAEPAKPPFTAAPEPQPLQVIQIEGVPGDPLVIDAMRTEVEDWVTWKEAQAVIERAETFAPMGMASLRVGEKLEGVVGWVDSPSANTLAVLDNIVMRNSDDIVATEKLLAVPARRAFDRDWSMTIQSVDSSGLPTIDLNLRAALIKRGAKEIDAGASGKYLSIDPQDLGAVFDLQAAKFDVPKPIKLVTEPPAPIPDPTTITESGAAEVAAFTDQEIPTTVSLKMVERIDGWLDEVKKSNALEQMRFAMQQDGVGLLQVRNGESLSAIATYSYLDNFLVVHGLVSPWSASLPVGSGALAVALTAEMKAIKALLKMSSSPPRGLVFESGVEMRKELVEVLEKIGFKRDVFPFVEGKVGITYADAQASKLLEGVELPKAAPELGAVEEAATKPYIALPAERTKIAQRVDDGEIAPVTPGGVTKEVGTSRLNKDLADGMRERGETGLKTDVMEALDARLRDSPHWSPEIVRDMYGMTGSRFSADPSKDVVAQLVQNWAITSSDADWRGVAIQIAAKEELGLGTGRVFAATYWRLSDEAKNVNVVEEAMRKLRDSPALRKSLRAFVRAQYEETQAYLKNIGVDEVTIYRGLSVNVDDPNVPWGVGLSVTPATDNPLAAWSIRHNVARRGSFFGGTMLRASVPREMIFSFPRTGFGCANEWEVLVINTGHNRVWVSQVGELPLTEDVLARLTAEKALLDDEVAKLAKSERRYQSMNDGQGPAYGSTEREELYQVREKTWERQSRIRTIEGDLNRGSVRYSYEKESELRGQITQALTENPGLAGKTIKPPGWTTAQWKTSVKLTDEIEALDRRIEAVGVRIKIAEGKVAEGGDDFLLRVEESKHKQLADERGKLQSRLEAIEERVRVKAVAKPTITPEVAAAKREITSLKRKITNRQKKIEREFDRNVTDALRIRIAEGEWKTLRELLDEAGLSWSLGNVKTVIASLGGKPYWLSRIRWIEEDLARLRASLVVAEEKLATAQAFATAKSRYTEDMDRLRRRVGL